ncbi:MAG: hypothetical protein AAGG07_12810 [Planctomycetota bacterium]
MKNRICPARGSAPLVLTLGLLTLSAVCVACEQRGIEEHTIAKGTERVPKRAPTDETAAPEAATPTEQPASASDAPADAWPWTVPEGWREDATPRQMRLATYVVDDPSGQVEVAVTRFGGRVGGDLANINRWRRQMGVAPVDETALESAITRFSSSGFDGYEVRIESDAGVMLASGVYDASINQMWFVRARLEDADAADRIAPALFQMARSIARAEGEG